MKKMISLLLLAAMVFGLFSGCGVKPAESGRLSVVTTIFPEYDWVTNILGEKAADTELTLLLDNGVDLHSYQPTAADMIKISGCDLFIYVGGESDTWVDDALKEATNQDMIVLDLMDILGDSVREEELVEGMEAEEEEEEGEEEEEVEYDEHVWLSLRNAAVCVNAIRDALCTLDGDNAEAYTANAAGFGEKLTALDEKYSACTENAARNVILFGDRFPFRYLADDYDLEYYAAFAGCSAESEASFETVAFLAGKVDELSLPAVLTLEGSDHKIAETVIDTSGCAGVEILSMDSMQSTTSKDIDSGASYLTIMEKNLSVLEKALN